MSDTMRFLRLPDVKQRTGKSGSTIYKDVADGLLPAPVRIGARASGWPEHELEAILKARLAGWPEDRVRALVAELMTQRAARAVREVRA